MGESRYYSPGSRRALQVERLFSRIAPRYDLINDLQSFGLHRLWKRRVIQIANPAPGAAALDLCCGTGDLAHALARRGARVTGCDFSPAMLSVAESRSRQDPGNPMFVRGDATALEMTDESFDLVTVGYGLRNLADMERGLREIARVLKPGGRVVILDFGKPDNAAWRAVYFAYLRLAVPAFGRVFAGDWDAYSYILESLRDFPAQRGVDVLLNRTGFHSTRIWNCLGGVMGINTGIRDARLP